MRNGPTASPRLCRIRRSPRSRRWWRPSPTPTLRRQHVRRRICPQSAGHGQVSERRPAIGTTWRFRPIFGGDWAMHTLHTFGDFRAYQNWSGPKKLTIGRPTISTGPSTSTPTSRCASSTTGSRASTPRSWTSRDQACSSKHRRLEAGSSMAATRNPVDRIHLHDGGLLSEHELFPSDSSTSLSNRPASMARPSSARR